MTDNFNTEAKKANPVDAYVGTKLKLRRSEIGLSQDKLGRLTNLTFQQIQKYEKGLNRIGSSRLYEFGKILKVPVSYFFEGYEVTDNGVNEVVSSDNYCLTESILEKNGISEKEIVVLIKNFSQIKDKKMRKLVCDLAKTSIEADNKEEK